MPYADLLTEAAELADDTVALRRDIHRHPELALQTPRTQAAVADRLDPLGLALHKGTATTSLVAVLDGDHPGPTVLLRADLDALALHEDTGLDFGSELGGAMHACGHDAHTAMLVGAARILVERRRELHGRVVFVFQPGEEGHGGARIMIDEGLLSPAIVGDGPVSAFAIHQDPLLASGTVASRGGPLMASADNFRIIVSGRGGHASMPHDALDPIPIACEIVQAIQSHVTRTVDVFDPAVVTVARISAGTAANIIPETATIDGTMRTVSDRRRATLRAGLARLATGIAEAHGARATLKQPDGYPPTVNDEGEAAWALDAARDLLGAERTLALAHPQMVAEDFAYVLQRVPGAMVFLGTRSADGPAGWTPQPNHSNRMRIDESALATGVALHARFALGKLAGR
ncbi:MAG: M20 family metallopeptidase [Acidimicrobiia bacterium]|nr:M20 family metallopeptidase [Acidimicrobiia bacterium]